MNLTKEKIKQLIEKYESEKSAGKISQYTEAETKTGFIEPLFQTLGWDTQNRDEVGLETNFSGGRVDYSFKISGVIKFFVEAKPLRADLDNPQYAQQAINYAWHKGVSWAVLTDFESIKVFNAEWKTKSIAESLFFEIKYTDYITNFDQLYLLSKQAISEGLLDKEAEKWGKKLKKQPVSKQILDDFLEARKKLTKNILNHPKLNKISEPELDESVQRILDRLIFIRTCEDRNIEQNHLLAAVRNKNKKSLWEELKKIFRKFDELYNSKLFEKHLCEQLFIDDEILEEIINSLYYTKDGSIYYDFSAINADVLGNIYEQYLGHILKKTPTSAKLKQTHQHRKEQGIYYTPTYIVDYIVKNTVGEILKNIKPKDAAKLRILDPACGSGSFLIRAFDELVDYWQKVAPSEFGYFRKIEILKNNIYGVDLDKQAVEITQMNLLLKTLQHHQKLPVLKNIKQGNSLIDDPQVGGENAFKWEEEFKEVMQEGGFDVVIGNPPYVMVENLPTVEREYLMKTYETAIKRFDIYIAFIEKAIKLLNKGGIVGFIIPYQFLTQDYAEKLRGYILNKCVIRQIVDLSQQKIFQEAAIRNIILIVEKGRRRVRTKIIHSIKSGVYTSFYINQQVFNKIPEKKFRTNIDENNIRILDKIISKSITVGKIAIASWGARGVPKEKFQLTTPINNLCKKMIKGEDVERYNIKYSGRWFLYDIKKLYRPAFPELFENEKLVFRGIIDKKGMVVSYDNNKYYTDHSLNCLILKYTLKNKEESFFGQRKINITEEDINLSKKFNLKFLLGIINSKLVNFCFNLYFSDELHVYPETIEQLPIPNVSESEQQPIIHLVDKMLELNKRLNQLGDKLTDERRKIEEEIKKTDTKIDELVYKLYGLTGEEIKIVEGIYDYFVNATKIDK